MSKTLLAVIAGSTVAIGFTLWRFGSTEVFTFYILLVGAIGAAWALSYWAPGIAALVFGPLHNWRRRGQRAIRRTRTYFWRAWNRRPVVPTNADPEDAEAPVIGRTWLYFVVLTAVAGAFFMAGSMLSTTIVVGFNLGYLVWIAGMAYFALGFRIIGPEELAGLQFWGSPTIVVTGSPIIILPGLFTVDYFSRSTIQMELPDEPENIYRQEDLTAVPEGKVPPVRITFAQGTDIKNDPLNERITAEVSAFVRFRIREFWSFFVRISNFKEARRQLSDSVISELQTKLGQLTVAQTYAQLERINDDLDNLVRKKTRDWGIELIDVRIKLIGLSHDLNKSISGVAQSVADKKKTINDADAKSYDLTKTGEGEANAIKLKLDAETEGLKKRTVDLGVSGADVLGARVAEAMGTSPSSKIVLGADELIKAGKKFAENFTKH